MNTLLKPFGIKPFWPLHSIEPSQYIALQWRNRARISFGHQIFKALASLRHHNCKFVKLVAIRTTFPAHQRKAVHNASPNSAHLPVPDMAAKLRHASGCLIIFSQASWAKHGVRRSKKFRRHHLTTQLITAMSEAAWHVGHQVMSWHTGANCQMVDRIFLTASEVRNLDVHIAQKRSCAIVSMKCCKASGKPQ